jgi:hypothetical protein
MTSSAATTDSCHVLSSSSLVVIDQVHRVGYSRSKVETDATDLELETDVTALELEMDVVALELGTDAAVLNLEREIDVSQEISKQERYSAN